MGCEGGVPGRADPGRLGESFPLVAACGTAKGRAAREARGRPRAAAVDVRTRFGARYEDHGRAAWATAPAPARDGAGPRMLGLGLFSPTNCGPSHERPNEDLHGPYSPTPPR